MTWYNSYTGFPYLHLGNNIETGIDCFNLCRLVYKEQLDIEIPYTTSDHCNIVDEDWYSKSHKKFLEDGFANSLNGWTKVTDLKKFDIILMSLGSTHSANHCALYVDHNKILQVMINHKSWVAPYGKYYKQYTTGIYRWKDMLS